MQQHLLPAAVAATLGVGIAAVAGATDAPRLALAALASVASYVLASWAARFGSTRWARAIAFGYLFSNGPGIAMCLGIAVTHRFSWPAAVLTQLAGFGAIAYELRGRRRPRVADV